MCSTRRTPDRFGAWSRKPAAAAAVVAAEDAEDAADAAAAEVAVAVAELAAQAAVFRGVLAAFARTDLRSASVDASKWFMAGFDEVDPAKHLLLKDVWLRIRVA